jgi:hypothetical protein
MIVTINTDLLVSVNDISAIGDVPVSVVCNWQNRYNDFPAPIYTNGQHHGVSAVWYWPDVASWMFLHDKFPKQLATGLHDDDVEF